jgi:hypothetical protein
LRADALIWESAEIRRWVIGQVFSYAAGVSQLSYEDLERAFAARGEDLASSFDGVEAWEATTFREAVEEHLERGAFRLVIAVEEITDELKRTIVYINRHTNDLQLLALELRHAEDEGVEILVPEVYGEESATGRGPRRPPTADEPSLIAGIRESQPPEIADQMIRLYKDRLARLPEPH